VGIIIAQYETGKTCSDYVELACKQRSNPRRAWSLQVDRIYAWKAWLTPIGFPDRPLNTSQQHVPNCSLSDGGHIMRSNVTIGFTEEEHLRLRGAAAVARLPVATYLKWLLQSSGPTGGVREVSMILARLDDIHTDLRKVKYRGEQQPIQVAGHATTLDVPRQPPLVPRELFETKLRQRGVPSSTIRQVTMVLDELEARP
jgi:hypothetical protein